jgi:3-dehydroquinate synthase
VSEDAVRVELGPRSYDVVVGADASVGLSAHLARVGLPPGPVVLVTDAWLSTRHAPLVKSRLEDAGYTVHVFALPVGEAAKSLRSLQRLWGFLLSHGVERNTPLIALGGGTVGDAAGFAASTYFRGIPLVHLPTTLLAQVDSAIGGKTAINHPRAKNAVGTFYQPKLVLADTSWLSTLEPRDIHSGLAEVVKAALLFSPEMAAWLHAHWGALVGGDLRALAKAVAFAAQAKAKVVARDEQEGSGLRHLLNFGHTFGHALEAATKFRVYRHGEAVARGMESALALSEHMGGLTREADRALARALVGAIATPALPEPLSERALLRALRLDKKVAHGRLRFVLLRELGEGYLCGDVPEARWRAQLAALVGPRSP